MTEPYGRRDGFPDTVIVHDDDLMRALRADAGLDPDDFDDYSDG